MIHIHPENKNKLNDLISRWENLARCKFIQAQDEDSEYGRRFIEHGAICYFNCASQLREFLAHDHHPR